MSRRPPKDLNANAPYLADGGRYDGARYRRCGRTGLKLPEVSLGLWQNFGDETPLASQREIIRTAFDKRRDAF